MLRDLLTWWVERMMELAPASFRERDARPADALVIEAAPATAEIMRRFRRRRRRETALGATGAARWASGRPVALRLARSDILEREVTLPLAAEQNLSAVLRYEMDRLTPFAAADVFWTATVTRRDRALDRLVARLVLVPRAGLLPTLAALAADGVPASVLEVPDPDRRSRDGWLVIALDQTIRVTWRRRAPALLAALCALLAVATVVTPPLRRLLALDRIEQSIAALRPRVDEAAALRRRIAAARADVDVAAAARANIGDKLAALAALTEILPDDTYLNELTLAGRHLELRGRSANQQAGGAARLIGVLAADPAIRNPAFAAPVVRDEAGHADLFSIQAEIAP